MEFAIALLAVVLLYLGTKDQWRWKVILLRGLGTVLIASAIGGTILGYFEWSERKDSKPRPISELEGIKLGASEADVRFQKGEPQRTEGAEWFFESDRYQLTVFFKDGRVRSVLVVPGGNRYFGLQNVQFEDSVSNILDELGQPDSILENSGGLMRTFCYSRLNTFLICTEGKVAALGIFNPSTGKPAFLNDDK